MTGCRKAPAPTEPARETSSTKTPTASAADLPAPVARMLGRWLRIDGGYVLEVRGGDRSGVLDAAYFNPRSIRVSRAIWMQGGGGHQIVVELNDVGYPGATYVLTYDAQQDRLVGEYTQPSMQQTFPVEFVRKPKDP